MFILKINTIKISNKTEVELLRLTIDHKLKFDAHINYAKQQGLNSMRYAESEKF